MPDYELGRILGIAAFFMLCVRLWRAWRARRSRLARERARQTDKP